MNTNSYFFFGESLDLALSKIKRLEKLSLEASIEELCKILLVKLFFERKNQQALYVSTFDANLFDESGSIYSKLFTAYVPSRLFEGWETIRIKSSCFTEIVSMLEQYCFAFTDKEETGRAFTSFLQMHYGGFINDYSTPDILSKYIFDVLRIEQIHSIFDPCCGIGGMLAEAYHRKGKHLTLVGNDISRMMVNISTLHLMMYGYKENVFSCSDFTKIYIDQSVIGYDCIVAHIPTRRQVFSLVKDTARWPNYDFGAIEEIFIENILKRLNPGGLAVVIVPSGLMEKNSKRGLRSLVLNKTEIVNITEFQDVSYPGNKLMTSYQILFFRNTNPAIIGGECSATLLNGNSRKKDICEAATWVKSYIFSQDKTVKIPSCKTFGLYELENWNVSLLFLRDRIGDQYPAVKLEEILTKRRDMTNLDPEKEYKVLRVRRRGMGVDVKRIVYGRDINREMFAVKVNDLVVSSFEADMGGIGLIPKDLTDAIVTKDLYLFEIDKSRVDLTYLLLVLTSDPVLEQLQMLNKRTYVLSRLSVSKFLSVVIPLPDLGTQKKMATGLKRFIIKAQNAEDELAEERKSFNKILFG